MVEIGKIFGENQGKFVKKTDFEHHLEQYLRIATKQTFLDKRFPAGIRRQNNAITTLF